MFGFAIVGEGEKYLCFVAFATQSRGSYTDTLLWGLVEKARTVDEDGKNARLRHTLLVTGRDAYAVALHSSQAEAWPQVSIWSETITPAAPSSYCYRPRLPRQTGR
jgi:hypothetical protein